LRGYIVAGRPDMSLKNWGSYEGWSALVRGAVVWAGLSDPADGREEVRKVSDRGAGALPALLAGIEHLDPQRTGLTVGQIIERIEWATEPVLRTLKEALLVLCPNERKPGALDAKSVGMKLHHLRGRNVGGKCLQRAGDTNAGVLWTVVPVEAVGDARGTKGT